MNYGVRCVTILWHLHIQWHCCAFRLGFSLYLWDVERSALRLDAVIFYRLRSALQTLVLWAWKSQCCASDSPLSALLSVRRSFSSQRSTLHIPGRLPCLEYRHIYTVHPAGPGEITWLADTPQRDSEWSKMENVGGISLTHFHTSIHISDLALSTTSLRSLAIHLIHADETHPFILLHSLWGLWGSCLILFSRLFSTGLEVLPKPRALWTSVCQ